MTNEEHDKIVAIAVDEAKGLIDEQEQKGEPFVWGEENDMLNMGSMLFDRVLPTIDDHYDDLNHLEAAPISDVCYEVASDIVHGDILGLLDRPVLEQE